MIRLPPKYLKIFLVIVITFNMLSFKNLFASPLKQDEDVIFFSSSANLSDGVWQLPIHHWVFEKEENSLIRKLAQKTFSEIFESLDVSEEEADSPLFKQRLMWFLVDNQSYKKIKIHFDENKAWAPASYKLKSTSANGHAQTIISLGNSVAKAEEWLTYKAEDKFKRTFEGEVQLIPEVGLSVISDIDDTIKISNVLDKKELIKNTFVNPYKTTKGFPEYYERLQKQGAFFHYVSASPWQLYPSLQSFMKQYPKGSISLRNFRLKDSSIVDFLKPSTEYKIKQISSIIQRYPKQQFILIGDSGEHDPDVYAEIYNRFPSNIKSIQIRLVEGSDLRKKRFMEVFKAVPQDVWQIFSEPPLREF